MFKARQKVDEFVESVKSSVYEETDTNEIEEIINEKEQYFEENDDIWDSKLIFRLWRRLFLRMMKEDGFEKQVKGYNDRIRAKSKVKQNKKKRNKLIGKAFAKADNFRPASKCKKPINDEIDRTFDQIGERIDSIQSSLDQMNNTIGGVRLEDIQNAYDSRYKTEKKIVNSVKQKLSSFVNHSDDERIKKVGNEVRSILRGELLVKRSLVRELLDATISTIGIKFHHDAWERGYNPDWPNQRKSAQLRKNCFQSIMQLIEQCNGTGEEIRSIMKTNIGFIQVNPIKTNHTFSSTHYETELPGIHQIHINAMILDNKEYVQYRCSVTDIGQRLSIVDDDKFHFQQSLPDELARRALKNPVIVNILKLDDWYRELQHRNKGNRVKRIDVSKMSMDDLKKLIDGYKKITKEQLTNDIASQLSNDIKKDLIQSKRFNDEF